MIIALWDSIISSTYAHHLNACPNSHVHISTTKTSSICHPIMAPGGSRRAVPNLSDSKNKGKRLPPSSPPKGDAKRAKSDSQEATKEKVIPLTGLPPPTDYMSFINPDALALYEEVEVASNLKEADHRRRNTFESRLPCSGTRIRLGFALFRPPKLQKYLTRPCGPKLWRRQK